MRVVIILPTYNEKENIVRIIPRLEDEIFPKLTDYDMYILVADDNSPDGTADEVRKLAKKWKNIEISSGQKKGLGAAYVRAMTYAFEKMGADVVFEMDADGQHDPEKIPQFLKKIEEGDDMVIGTRYSGGGSIPKNWPPQRKAFSMGANLLVRTIFMRFSIHDWTGGFRALKKEVFMKEKKELENFDGYIFQISFLHKAVRDGFKIGEVPFNFTDRTLGKSKIAPLGYIYDVLSYIIIARIIELQRFIKFLIVGVTGFIVQVSVQEVFARFIVPTLIATSDSLRDGIAAGFGAEAAIVSNFTFNNLWTFSDTNKVGKNSHLLVKFAKFNLTSLGAILVQFSSVFIFVSLLGENIYIGDYHLKTRIAVLVPTIIFIVIPMNYFIYNKIIWKTQKLKENNK